LGSTGPAAAGTPLTHRGNAATVIEYTPQLPFLKKTKKQKENISTYRMGLPGPAEDASLLASLGCDLAIWS